MYVHMWYSKLESDLSIFNNTSSSASVLLTSSKRQLPCSTSDVSVSSDSLVSKPMKAPFVPSTVLLKCFVIFTIRLKTRHIYKTGKLNTSHFISGYNYFLPIIRSSKAQEKICQLLIIIKFEGLVTAMNIRKAGLHSQPKDTLYDLLYYHTPIRM